MPNTAWVLRHLPRSGLPSCGSRRRMTPTGQRGSRREVLKLAGLIIAFCVWTLFIVAWIQIITKAGYSPWWILLPVSLVVLWIIDIFLLFRSLSAVTGYS